MEYHQSPDVIAIPLVEVIESCAVLAVLKNMPVARVPIARTNQNSTKTLLKFYINAV
jgi:hypothetical protein